MTNLFKQRIIENINVKKYFSNNFIWIEISIFISKGNLYIKVKAKKILNYKILIFYLQKVKDDFKKQII